MSAFRHSLFAPLALVAALAAIPARADTPLGAQWVSAVEDEDGVKLNKIASDKSKLNAAVLDYQRDGEGAIHVAVRKGNALYLRFMLGLDANPNLISERGGESPLTLAVVVNQPEMLRILLANRAKIDQGNKSGETPLIKAVKFRRLDMIQTLLAAGADADKKDYSGTSARAYAAADVRSPQIVKVLADAPRKTVKAVSGPHIN